MTFTASCGDEMIGTLTLRVDSPSGLCADQTFSSEMANLRARPRASLCELTKFAFDPSADSRPLLAKLFHVIFLYGTQRFACSDLVIEVNPRHVVFYEAMLGFSRVGDLRTNDMVHAPSQLMHLAVSQIGKEITRQAGGMAGSLRSLYPYFFGKDDEQALRQRIAASASMGPPPGFYAQVEGATMKLQRTYRTLQRKRAAA